jgi:hypothetical protein
VAAPCAAAGRAPAAGRTGGGSNGLAAGALADKATGGHQPGYLFAVAYGALGLMGTQYQAFKILTALLTVILINRHSMSSLSMLIYPPPKKIFHDFITLFPNLTPAGPNGGVLIFKCCSFYSFFYFYQAIPKLEN